MKRRSGAGAVFSLALACVFGATLLLSLATGAKIYRQVQERVEWASAQRVGLTYITAKIHANDSLRDVAVESFGGQDALFLLEDLGGITYETILYVYDGALMELFCERGWELAPEAGQVIAQARSLQVRTPLPGFLELVYTGADGISSTAEVFLRSGGRTLHG